MNYAYPIKIFSVPSPSYITNPFPNATDPYNATYESVNWTEIYQYYPPNGISAINPYQRAFSPTRTHLLQNPYIFRVTSTPFTPFSFLNS